MTSNKFMWADFLFTLFLVSVSGIIGILIILFGSPDSLPIGLLLIFLTATGYFFLLRDVELGRFYKKDKTG